MKKLLELLEKLFEPANTEKEKIVEPPRDGRVKGDGAIEVIIVSDNHGSYHGLAKIVDYHINSDYFLHCGDSNLEPKDELMARFVAVKGNTDIIYNYQENEFVELETEERILITHGHKFAVGFGMDKLLTYAKSLEKIPNMIFYGHTHKVDVQMLDHILIINPGSVQQPRDENPRAYAKLRITPNAYDIEVLAVKDHRVIKEFQFPRESPQPNQAPE